MSNISILAPRAGSDTARPRPSSCTSPFQSSLPVRGATCLVPRTPLSSIFQSSLPVRGATDEIISMIGDDYISILAPRAGSDLVGNPIGYTMPISILAPRAGSDVAVRRGRPRVRHFNPRSPCGERRPNVRMSVPGNYFNPRSPCGERRGALWRPGGRLIFQSSLPVRGATWPREWAADRADISILAPRAGSDGDSSPPAGAERDFNPRSPCGERPVEYSGYGDKDPFQSSLPVRGATIDRLKQELEETISILAPRAGSDLVSGNASYGVSISILAPRAGSDAPQRIM